MTVNITWSTTDNGTAVTQPINHGNVPNGGTTTAIELFVRHDGDNVITNCGLYLSEYSATYTGSNNKTFDRALMFTWGDSAVSNTFGGIQINMNQTGSFPNGSWPTYDNHSPAEGFVFATGQGEDSSSPIILSNTMGLGIAGRIDSGFTSASLNIRVKIPSSYVSIDTIQVDTTLKYTYTS
jgi:hypothetical protein